MDTKELTAPALLKTEGDEAGHLTAAFSTFDVKDRDGDVVLASAFTDGQEIPMVWAHDWTKPIGKGVVRVEPTRAVFEGRLWLDTQDGAEAYKKIKNAGPLQEYSWGFQVLDAAPGEMDGQPVRFIKRAEAFEVSPVLVGAAGRDRTQTLSIKVNPAVRREAISKALRESLPLEDHEYRVQADLELLIGRLKALAADEPEGKQGRALSQSREERFAGVADGLEGHAREIRQILADAKPKGDGKAIRELRNRSLRRITELRLIAV